MLGFTQISILLVSILSIVILLYYKYVFQYWQNLGVPHLKPSFPFGNFERNFMRNLDKSVDKIYKEMKRTGAQFCGYYLFTIPVFMPISPELVKYVLSQEFQSFHDRGIHCDEENDPMGVNLVTCSGDTWRNMRRQLTLNFSSAKLKQMFPIMAACGKHIENLLKEVTRTAEPVDMYDIAGRYSTDVICSCAFGLECNSLKYPNADFRKYGQMITDTSILNSLRMAFTFCMPKVNKFFKIQMFSPKATKFLHKVVKETVDYREKYNIDRADIMQVFIQLMTMYKEYNNESSESLTLNQVAAQCVLFFVAGFETTSSTIKYCMYELALNQNIQDKVREEVLSVLKEHNGEITYDAIMEMTYLENVVSETLRKYPIVFMLNRKCTEDVCIPDTNIILKKGTSIAISVMGLHKDPEYYPDPEKFDPNRFTEEEKAKRPAFTYLPFGEGPRICIGLRFGILEIKAFIAKLVRNHRFTLHPSVTVPLKTRAFGVVLTSVDPVLLLSHNIS